jgi:aspartate racemase
LADAPTRLPLPADRLKPGGLGARTREFRFEIEGDLIEALNKIHPDNSDHSLGATLLGIFALLLQRLSRQDDLIIGVFPTKNPGSATEPSTGSPSDALPVRLNLSGDPTMSDLLGHVGKVMAESLAHHQEIPFKDILPQLQLEDTPALFQVQFGLQAGPVPPSPAWDFETGHPGCELCLLIKKCEKALACRFVYNPVLFESFTIERYSILYTNLLRSFLAQAHRKAAELAWLDDEERQKVVHLWNQTQRACPSASLAELFGEQVTVRPHAVALVFAGRKLTYAELDLRANQVANYLVKAGVKPDRPVALFFERSHDLIVAILGIIKAGAAYMGMDPDYPSARLAFMLEDAKAPVILTHESLRHRLPASPATVICLDRDWPQIEKESFASLRLEVNADQLACICYTSGSTGRPKGVALYQRAVVNLAKCADFVAFSPEEIVLQFSPVGFDASIFEIWGALLNGAKLVVMAPGLPSLEELGRVIRDEKISILWLTSALFHLMVDERLDDLRGVRQLIAGGDVISVQHVRKVIGELAPCRMINGYGPTENTTFTNCHVVTEADLASDFVPIGRPIANTRVYILDEHRCPVPIGIPGQIHTTGQGLAKGYLGLPGLTAEKFIPDPFSSKPDGRLYQTGDRARWRMDGTIEFLGRVDFQVKIDGYRIEPDEVEAALRAEPGVKAAAVINHVTDDRKRLVGYVTGAVSGDSLRQRLQQRLPYYLVPDLIMVVDALPINANGKLDRPALPRPVFASKPSNYVAPRTEVEKKLAKIWQDVLGIPRVGLKDNFFELGGRSLLAAKMFAQINKTLGKNLPIPGLFKAPTIKQLAVMFFEQPKSSAVKIHALQMGGTRPPLFLMPGPGAEGQTFDILVRQLGPDQPAFVLQAKALLGASSPPVNITEIARLFAEEITALNPTGACAIGGRNFGAVLAWETAGYLAAKGRTVSLLALIEPPPAAFFTREGAGPAPAYRFVKPAAAGGRFGRFFKKGSGDDDDVTKELRQAREQYSDAQLGPSACPVAVFTAHGSHHPWPELAPGGFSVFSSAEAGPKLAGWFAT